MSSWKNVQFWKLGKEIGYVENWEDKTTQIVYKVGIMTTLNLAFSVIPTSILQTTSLSSVFPTTSLSYNLSAWRRWEFPYGGHNCITCRLLHSPSLVAIGLSVDYKTWLPIGWHNPVVLGWLIYRFGLPHVTMHFALTWTAGIYTIFRCHRHFSNACH